MSGSRFVFIVKNMISYIFLVLGNIIQCVMGRRYLFNEVNYKFKLQAAASANSKS